MIHADYSKYERRFMVETPPNAKGNNWTYQSFMSGEPNLSMWKAQAALWDNSTYQVQVIDIDLTRNPVVQWRDAYLLVKVESGKYKVRCYDNDEEIAADYRTQLRMNPKYQPPLYPKA